MRAGPAALLLAAILLAGCRQEPDFDERYDKAQAAIRARAAAIDRDLAAAAREARATAPTGEPAVTPSPGPR